MKWTTWLCRLLPICVCSSRNQSTADRWINKTNYKLAALSTFAFRFSMNRKRFAAHHVWECVCLYLFYLYLIIINCIQTSLLWDANKETTTLVTCIENVPAAYPLSLFLSLPLNAYEFEYCVCVDSLIVCSYEKWRVSYHSHSVSVWPGRPKRRSKLSTSWNACLTTKLHTDNNNASMWQSATESLFSASGKNKTNV